MTFLHMHHAMANKALELVGAEASTTEQFWRPDKMPHLSWASDIGRQILARHGIDSDLVAAATRLACSEHFTADGKMAMEEFSAQAALAGYALPAVPSFEPSGPELTNTPPSVT